MNMLTLLLWLGVLVKIGGPRTDGSTLVRVMFQIAERKTIRKHGARIVTSIALLYLLAHVMYSIMLFLLPIQPRKDQIKKVPTKYCT